MAVINSDYVRRLECENAELKCFNAKLEDMNKDLKQKAAQAESVIDDFMDNIYTDVAEECGCVVDRDLNASINLAKYKQLVA